MSRDLKLAGQIMRMADQVSDTVEMEHIICRGYFKPKKNFNYKSATKS